jgi:hypothetical protein
MKQDWRIEPILLLLCGGIFLSVVIMLFCEHYFKDDGQIFQVVSNLVAGFSGAFFGRMSPRSMHQQDKDTTDSNKGGDGSV